MDTSADEPQRRINMRSMQVTDVNKNFDRYNGKFFSEQIRPAPSFSQDDRHPRPTPIDPR